MRHSKDEERAVVLEVIKVHYAKITGILQQLSIALEV